jgi:hypothetical protein
MATEHTNILGGSRVLPVKIATVLKALLPSELQQLKDYVDFVAQEAHEEGYEEGVKAAEDRSSRPLVGEGD